MDSPEPPVVHNGEKKAGTRSGDEYCAGWMQTALGRYHTSLEAEAKLVLPNR